MPMQEQWEKTREENERLAMEHFGKPFSQLSNVEETFVRSGGDSGATPQNPGGAEGATRAAKAIGIEVPEDGGEEGQDAEGEEPQEPQPQGRQTAGRQTPPKDDKDKDK